jgi:hypothetical protein
LLLGHSPQAAKVADLRFEVVRRAVEPIAPPRPSMNAERPAKGVAELSLFQKILFRE